MMIMKRNGCPPGTYRIDHVCKNFRDTHFMSAKKKHLIYNNYRGFLDSLSKDYNRTSRKGDQIVPAPLTKFSEQLYEHLSNNCGFIACSNKDNFYHTYFDDPDATVDFLERMMNAEKACSNDYSDVNEAISVETKRKAPQILKSMELLAKKRDIETANNLLKKYGLKIR